MNLNPSLPGQAVGRGDQPARVGRRAAGFTLLEVLMAVGIFAIVLFAMNTVFFSALKLERSVTRMLDARGEVNDAFALLRRDLLGAVPPLTNAALLTRDFVVTGSGGRISSAQSGTLDFYTTTATVTEELPWGEVQQVRYELVAPQERPASGGMELVRVVTRNILAVSSAEQEEQLVAGNIESLEFECFNGSSWQNTWDTTKNDVGLPQAVRVRLLLGPETAGAKITRDPLEIVVPLVSQTLTNSLAGGAL